MTLPSLTLSPTLTLSSLTVPAAGEGTSIVALSDSSVTSESSFFTASPGLTNTSITGTSLKSPMSGTLTSIWLTSLVLERLEAPRSMDLAREAARRTARASEHDPPHVAEQRNEVCVEPRRRGAVDHAVVVGERQRQDQPRRELLAVPHRTRARAAYAEDRDLGRVDDGSEIRSAYAAEARNREATALHVGRTQLALARLGRQIAHLLGNREHALLVGVLHHRHHQPVGRVGRETHVVVLLVDQVVAVERGVEL